MRVSLHRARTSKFTTFYNEATSTDFAFGYAVSSCMLEDLSYHFYPSFQQMVISADIIITIASPGARNRPLLAAEPAKSATWTLIFRMGYDQGRMQRSRAGGEHTYFRRSRRTAKPHNFLCHDLAYVLRDETAEIITWKRRRNSDAPSAEDDKTRSAEYNYLTTPSTFAKLPSANCSNARLRYRSSTLKLCPCS